LDARCVADDCVSYTYGITTEAYVGYAKETAPFAVDDPSCVPDEAMPHIPYFSPAVACPVGYVTATAGTKTPSVATTGDESLVYCCPS